ncbi:DHHC palmitoyltransferase-domain-containing protein [Sporodiniella umbellata]|nr:DHHC palmitoyltransferase-domain-containing protein [Sporodiniella umbellata]
MFTVSTLKGPLIIVGVTLSILFFTFTSQLFVIWPYLITHYNLTQTIGILAPLNCCVVMTFINYFLTCFTHPGSVPVRYIPRQQAFIEVKKSTHAPRFCKTCDNYKPPRTHHCSICNRCVLKMDHHCPWINNCVGFFNYCHFIRLIVYANVTSLYIFVLLSCRAYQIIHHVSPASLEVGFLCANMIGLTVVIIGLSILTGYHTYCITTNTTTIEAWEKGRSLTIQGLGRTQNVRKPYHQGLYKNLKIVLGPYPFLWWFPLSMEGQGLEFPVYMRYSDEEKLTEKDYSSTTRLNRPLSVETFRSAYDTDHLSTHHTIPISTSTFSSNTTTLI